MFGAEPAMFMLAGVALAFLGTEPAGGFAGLKDRDDGGFVAARPTSAEITGRDADVCAVEIEANALPQVLHHFLGKAGICAGNAGLGASITFLDASDQGVIGIALDARVGGDHLAHMMHDWLLC
jgi:hypothetical protein